MDLYDVFASPFTLSKFEIHREPVLQMKSEFITNDIFGETTKEEIFIISKMFFDQIILQHKNYVIDDHQTTESSYGLFVGIYSDGELNFKHIYSCSYNNVLDRVSWENKYDDNFSIEGTFFVCIDVKAMYFEDYDPYIDEDEDDLPIRKTITESECIICYENKPNMLFTECMHLCVCNICDIKGRFSKCPMCRTQIKTNNKIKLT